MFNNEYKTLMYEHEVLWARYEIRNHYLQKTVQEVYENIGQVLSLVRVQLSLLSNENELLKTEMTEPGHLVGKVIKDLRTMCHNFYPETELLAKTGLVSTLEYELKLLDAGDRHTVKVEGTPNALEAGKELIVFRMLQEILVSIRQQHKEASIYLKIIYDDSNVCFEIEYAGDPIEWKQPEIKADAALGLTRLSLPDRVQLIDSKLKMKNSELHKTHIELIVPFKTPVYEQQ